MNHIRRKKRQVERYRYRMPQHQVPAFMYTQVMILDALKTVARIKFKERL